MKSSKIPQFGSRLFKAGGNTYAIVGVYLNTDTYDIKNIETGEVREVKSETIIKWLEHEKKKQGSTIRGNVSTCCILY